MKDKRIAHASTDFVGDPVHIFMDKKGWGGESEAIYRRSRVTKAQIRMREREISVTKRRFFVTERQIRVIIRQTLALISRFVA